MHRNLSVLRAVSASQACMCLGSDVVFLGRRISWSCPQGAAVGLGLGPLPCPRVSAGGGGSVPLPTLHFVPFPAGQAREDTSCLLTQGATLLQVMGETDMPEYIGFRPKASPRLCFDSLFLHPWLLWALPMTCLVAGGPSCLPRPASPHIPSGQQKA